MAIRDPLRSISKMAISRFNEVLGYFSVTGLVTKKLMEQKKKELLRSKRSISCGRDEAMTRK